MKEKLRDKKQEMNPDKSGPSLKIPVNDKIWDDAASKDFLKGYAEQDKAGE